MLHKVCNFGPSSHNLAILGTKMVQKWDFLKNPANPHDEIFSEGLVSHCSQISVWIMDPLRPPNPLGSCWKKIYLILEQFSNEFLRGCGFESRLRQFGFSTYLLWAITNVSCWPKSFFSPDRKKNVLKKKSTQFSIRCWTDLVFDIYPPVGVVCLEFWQ